MQKHPIHNFIALVEFDRKLTDLERLIKQKQDDIIQLKEKHDQADQLAIQANLSMRDTQKVVDFCELRARDLEASAVEKKQILENVTLPRARRSAQLALDHIHQEQEQNERKMIASWDGLERARVKVVEQNKLVVEQQDKVTQSVEAAEAVVVQFEQDYKDLDKDRQVLVDKVPEEWLEKYVSMRGRVDNPVVQVQGQACGACFFLLATPDRIALQMKALRQCGNCFRFLYHQSLIEGDQESGVEPEDEQEK